MTAAATVRRQLRELGLRPGDVVVVHTAFSKVRPVEGGPLGLIHALQDTVGTAGTLVMPTMSAGDAPFRAATTPTLDMGVVAETFRQAPGVVRSTHPGASFAACGPMAAAVCAPQPLVPLHGPDSPIGRVYRLGGKVLLLGVGHDASTTCHLAEVIHGVPYWQAHPCVVEQEGGAASVLLPESDHCCEGFARIRSHLEARTGPVGGGVGTCATAAAVVTAALALLRADSLAFLCDAGAGCVDCDRARANIGRPRPRVPHRMV